MHAIDEAIFEFKLSAVENRANLLCIKHAESVSRFLQVNRISPVPGRTHTSLVSTIQDVAANPNVRTELGSLPGGGSSSGSSSGISGSSSGNGIGLAEASHSLMAHSSKDSFLSRASSLSLDEWLCKPLLARGHDSSAPLMMPMPFVLARTFEYEPNSDPVSQRTRACNERNHGHAGTTNRIVPGAPWIGEIHTPVIKSHSVQANEGTVDDGIDDIEELTIEDILELSDTEVGAAILRDLSETPNGSLGGLSERLVKLMKRFVLRDRGQLHHLSHAAHATCAALIWHCGLLDEVVFIVRQCVDMEKSGEITYLRSNSDPLGYSVGVIRPSALLIKVWEQVFIAPYYFWSFVHLGLYFLVFILFFLQIYFSFRCSLSLSTSFSLSLSLSFLWYDHLLYLVVTLIHTHTYVHTYIHTYIQPHSLT